jgi:hypothetical protein
VIAAAAALAFNLVVYGAHAVAPFRLAGAEGDRRRLWTLAAPLALVASFIVTVAWVARRPDEAIVWGLTDPLTGSLPARLIAVAWVGLALGDLVAAAGWRRLEPAAWRVLGALGVLGALFHTLGSELLRTGAGPTGGSLATLVAMVLLRLPLTLAAGELLTGGPRLWGPIAGPSLVAALWSWPAELRAALGADRITLLAAAALLLSARFVPASLRRVAGWAGFALATLFLARSAEVSRILGATERLPGILLAP